MSDTTSTKQTPMAHVLQTTELLERALVMGTLTQIRTAALVCKQWKATMETSPTLRLALYTKVRYGFWQMMEAAEKTGLCINLRLVPWLVTLNNGHLLDESGTFIAPENLPHSWRDMQLTSPPLTSFRMRVEYDSFIGTGEKIYHQYRDDQWIELEQDTGVTAGMITESVETFFRQLLPARREGNDEVVSVKGVPNGTGGELWFDYQMGQPSRVGLSDDLADEFPL